MKTFVNIGFAGIVFAAMVSCSGASADVASNANDNSEKIYPVRVQKIQKQVIEKDLEYTANLIAFKEVNYAPASPGRINKINVEVGSRVTKGQVLVELDRTQLSQAITQLASAKSNYQRIDTLYGLGSISEQQFDQAKTQYDIAQSNVDFLMENTTLLSPINGIVTGKYYENGEFYSGAPNTASGKAAIISLMQINPLKVIVNVSQAYFPVIKEGMEVSVRTDTYAEASFKGSIHKVHPTINPSTRTFQVEVIVENSAEKLRPGMFGTINIKLKSADALVVPAISVLKQEGTNNRYVFINNNGQAKQVEVTLGKRFDNMVELKTNGVQEGMELVVEGQAILMNGSKVEVVAE